MRRTTRHNRTVLAIIAAVALTASACGGGVDGPTEVVNSSGVAKTGWDTPVAEAPVEASPDNDAGKISRSIGTPAVGATSDDGEQSEIAASVLAYVIENSEGVSYSFEQGFSMSFEFDEVSMQIAPGEAFVTGEVDGADSHIRADIGVVMRETFTSLGLDPDDAEFAALGSAFDNARFDVWTEGDVMTLDMADFLSAMDELDPGSMPGLASLSTGPVSIDLSGLDSVDPWMLTQALGEGSQVVDPSALVDALRSVDSVSEIGPSSIDGRAVTVYSGTLSMDDYFSAMGQDIDEQLAVLDDFGAQTNGVETELLDSVGGALSDLDVHVTVMVDDQNRLRRMETLMNMGEMMAAMFGDSMQIEMSVGVWQEFDQYGSSFDIDAPDSVDVTDDFGSLFGELVTA